MVNICDFKYNTEIIYPRDARIEEVLALTDDDINSIRELPEILTNIIDITKSYGEIEIKRYDDEDDDGNNNEYSSDYDDDILIRIADNDENILNNSVKSIIDNMKEYGIEPEVHRWKRIDI